METTTVFLGGSVHGPLRFLAGPPHSSMASLGFGQSPWEMTRSVERIALGTPGLAKPGFEGVTLLTLRSSFPSSKSTDGEENRAL